MSAPTFHPYSHGFAIVDDAARRGGIRVIRVVVESIYDASRTACVGPVPTRKSDPLTPSFIQLDRLASRPTLAVKIRQALKSKTV